MEKELTKEDLKKIVDNVIKFAEIMETEPVEASELLIVLGSQVKLMMGVQ